MSAFSYSPSDRRRAMRAAVSAAMAVWAWETFSRFSAAVLVMESYWAAPMPPLSPRTSA